MKTTQRSGLNILQKFSILSFLWVFLFIIVSGYLLSYHMKNSVMEREGTITSDFVRARVKERLAFQDSPEATLQMESRSFAEMFGEIRKIPEIVSIEVYSPERSILWSDREEVIGLKSPLTLDLQRALNGKDVVSLDVDPQKFYPGRYPRHLLAVYVPIFDETGREMGVVATYKASTAFYESLRAGRNSAWSLSVVGGVLFYTSFFGLFYGAYRNQKKMDEGLRDLNRDLMALNSHLESMVEERTRDLKRSRDDIRAVFDAVTDIILVKDLDDNILMANRSAPAIFNREQDGIIGEKCYRLFMGGDSPCPGCMEDRIVKEKKAVSHEVMHIKTGEIFDLSIFPVINEKGEVQKVIEYAKVVTPQKRLERKMIQTDKLSALGGLIGEIAHQLNNPLVGVINMAQIAMTQMDKEDTLRSDLKGIEKAGVECKRVIKKFLDFTKPARFELHPADINLLMDNSLEIIESQIRQRYITVEKMYGQDLPHVNVDHTLMMQVFFNIINNAREAMSNGGRLTITTSMVEDGWLGISFIDTGPGIKEEHLSQIFSPFFTTKEEEGGTGLGLRVAANVINTHGGRIFAESREGKGAAFHIRLPIGSGGANEGSGVGNE